MGNDLVDALCQTAAGSVVLYAEALQRERRLKEEHEALLTEVKALREVLAKIRVKCQCSSCDGRGGYVDIFGNAEECPDCMGTGAGVDTPAAPLKEGGNG